MWFCLMIIVIITGCIGNPSGQKPQTTTAPSGPPMQDITGQIVILQHQGSIDPESNRYLVSGTAKNRGPAIIDVTGVVVKFYDKTGGFLSDGSASTIDLKPGGAWDFEVAYGGAGTSVGNYTIDIAD